MKLRDYQEAAVESIFNYFLGNTGNPVVAMPTGTGKSVVIAGFVQRALTVYPGTRIMKLTHVKELIQQNLDKLLTYWPTAPAGVYSAGLKRKEVGLPIVFGGVGTVARANTKAFGRIDLLLIDECHLVSPKETTMYQQVIRKLREVNPAMKVVGFTATHYRLGQGSLVEEGGLFTDICFNLTSLEAFNWLLAQGYLARLVPRPTDTQFDLSGVRTQRGEYKQDELQAAMDRAELTYSAVQEMIRCGGDRHHWLVFAAGIEHAEHVATTLTECGVPATYVHSKMGDAQRDANIRAFKTGAYRAMVNNGVLTTGFDFPDIDLIGVLRPTQSASLWVQMLGRGTRPIYANGYVLDTPEGRLASIAASDKPNCLVLDFAGNARRLGPINDPVLPKRKGKGGGGVAPIKLCEVCGTYNHASVRFCEHCGAEFPKILKIQEVASSDALIADGPMETPKTEVFQVDRVVYHEHRKDNRPPSIQVSYYCGLRMFREWICLEHPSYAGKKARDWWRGRSTAPIPATTLEALTQLDTLKPPTHIRVWLKTKYDEVMAYDFTGTAFGEPA